MGSVDKKMAVYRILNLVSGKFYIGSSANLYERWRTHRKKLRSNTHPNPHLQASWNKHGEDLFKFEILAEFESLQDMFVCEEGLIDTHIDDPLCMNVSRWTDTPMRGRTGQAHPNYGKKLTEKQKRHISEATKKQWQTSDPRTGKKHSEETRVKISAKVQAALDVGKGGKFIPSEETRKKMSEALKGNQCAKGYKRTDAEKEAIRQRTLGNKNWLGKKHSEEAKAKMSRAVIAVSPEGVETKYVSITALRQALQITPPTVDRALKSGKPLAKGARQGWKFMYCVDT